MDEKQQKEALELLRYYADLEAGLRKSYGFVVNKKIGKVNKADEFLKRLAVKIAGDITE